MNFFFGKEVTPSEVLLFFPIQLEFPKMPEPFVNNLMKGSLGQYFREEMQDGEFE